MNIPLPPIRRRISRASVVLLLLALPVLNACADEEPPPEIIRPVMAVQVLDASGAFDRWFPGRAKAHQDANIAFEVPGRLIERPVQIGDRVTEGQLLAKLDPRDYRNALNQAAAVERRSRIFRDRVAEAAKTGAVSRQEVTDAQAALDAARAEVGIRRKQLEDSTLYAPFDGTVSAILVENFENVLGKQTIMRVLDTSRMEMVINIPETLISNRPNIEGMEVRFDAFPGRAFPAQLFEVSNEATEATRTYPVNLIYEQPDDVEILPGMAGEARSVWKAEALAGRPEGVEVRLSALITDDQDASYVWVIDPETQVVSRREVQLGETTTRGVVIGGVNQGEWVAVAGAKTLQEGQKVRLVEQGRRG